MYKNIIKTCLVFSAILWTFGFKVWAEEIDFEMVIENSSISIPESISLWQEVQLDIKDIDTRLRELGGDTDFDYSWDIYNRWPVESDTETISFDSYGDKKISLNIYNNSWDRPLLYSTDFDIFVYKSSIPLIVSSTITEDEKLTFIENAKENGVSVHELGSYDEEKIDGKDILLGINRYKKNFQNMSDYIHIWWEKEFLLSTLSGIGIYSEDIGVRNFVLTSSYNAEILKSYLWNSLAWRDFIDTAFIIDESQWRRIINNPLKISELINDLEINNYEYTSISNEESIFPALFLSRFINTLSLSWVPTSDIYIILLLPIFLTLVGISKHLIWISTLGSIIPVFLAILCIKIGLIFSLVLISFLLICNIWLSYFLNKYTLLYTPKVTCITIINFVLFTIVLILWNKIGIFSPDIEHILYIVIFFIIAEKLITIITSKEFREYKKSLAWTWLIAIFWTMLYSFDSLLVFLTAYPEFLILLVPFNFFLWRFTGLRITEYLRFREIVKNIEE